MKTTIAMMLAAAFALAGCKNKTSTPAAGSATSAAPTEGSAAGSAGSAAMAGSAAAGSAATMAGSGSSAALDVPTEEDFEGQAKAQVTDKNLTTQVKALEDDLGN